MKILRGGTLVSPHGLMKGDLALEGDKIAQVGGHVEETAEDEVIDVTGTYVFPGFIDAHKTASRPARALLPVAARRRLSTMRRRIRA